MRRDRQLEQGQRASFENISNVRRLAPGLDAIYKAKLPIRLTTVYTSSRLEF